MLFIPIKFKTYVQLSPSELDSKYQERIYEKVRAVYEGTCTKFGYIKPKSIDIVKRSCGSFVKQHFNGAIRFDLICRGEVCNPVQGSIVTAIVKNKNLLGILAESTMELDGDILPILDIIVPINSAGIISDVSLDSISIGDTVDIEVMGKKYQIKDKKISIIGRVIVMKGNEKIPSNEDAQSQAGGDVEDETGFYHEDDGEDEDGDDEDGDTTVKNDSDEEDEDEEDEDDSEDIYDDEDVDADADVDDVDVDADADADADDF
jgi:DNA-directed RNA polymerase subunit E'/Rpb7